MEVQKDGMTSKYNRKPQHFSLSGYRLENLCTRTAQSSRGGQLTGGKNGVFMCTLLLKNVINFLIFYF